MQKFAIEISVMMMYLLCRYVMNEAAMETRVQRWGNSLALRIPKHLADEAGLTANTCVRLSLHGRELVIVPVLPAAYNLEDVLALVTEQNRHGEVETDTPVGGEAW